MLEVPGGVDGRLRTLGKRLVIFFGVVEAGCIRRSRSRGGFAGSPLGGAGRSAGGLADVLVAELAQGHIIGGGRKPTNLDRRGYGSSHGRWSGI